MSEREERRFVEIPRESVRLMAESTGLELSDEVAALLAEDVCYRLREATQNSSQFMKHTKRRKLTVEDFNRALRWSSVEAVCGYGSQEALPLRLAREGELYFPEDREVNLVELALATNIPKGCAETAVRVHVSYLDGKGNLAPQGSVPSAVSSLTDDLLKYYQQVTRAVLGDDPQLMKIALQDLQTNSKIAALLPYFVYVVSGVKSVSHDLEQLHRLLQVARSLVRNPHLCLGPYVRSLVGSVLYCVLEPLAASINPLNDHWTLRDGAALLLSHIFWTHGDLVSGLYQQILLSLQKVLADPVRPLCSHYGAVVGLHALGWKVRTLAFPHRQSHKSSLVGWDAGAAVRAGPVPSCCPSESVNRVRPGGRRSRSGFSGRSSASQPFPRRKDESSGVTDSTRHSPAWWLRLYNLSLVLQQNSIQALPSSFKSVVTSSARK
uniref:TAF6-like RNA polymerase II p300/CBP-associated factor-associated factor 65 kDa subunit 6L n=1 Tax=Neovison vison TaxID=452646 RepID=A0A8C7BSM7_NEOVI